MNRKIGASLIIYALLQFITGGFGFSAVKATDAVPQTSTLTTHGPEDFYFDLEAGTTFTARADAWSHGIDSQLWFYNSQGTVVAVNDDYFGLDSYISYDVQTAGTYRLRTSICCGNPNSWRGQFYTVDTNSVATNAPPTTTTTTTTTTSTTTTTLAPYLNPPTNVQVTSVSSDKIYISWDAPQSSNTDIEQYIVLVDCNDGSQPHLGAISQNTHASIENLPSATTCDIRVRADNDTVHAYSAYSESITGVTETTTTTTTSTTTTSTTTTTTTIPPTTTTTTTLPLTNANNGCGPYRAMTVTGTTGGTVWGTGPYTDDSNFAAAAVHAGLIEVGETAVIEPYAVDNYDWYDDGYANGVHTNDWHSPWCGYQIKLLGSPTPTTTTSTTTTMPIQVPTITTTSTTTTTTEAPSVSYPINSTTTTLEPEVTTTTEAPTEETVPVETPPSEGDTQSDESTTSVPQYAPEQETTTDETPIVVPQGTQDAADAAVADIFDTPISDAKLADAVGNLISDAGSPEELTAVVTSLLDQDLTDTQFATVIDSIFSEPLSDKNFNAAVEAVFADTTSLTTEQFDAAVQTVFADPLSTEQFSAALNSVFDEPISDEKFDSIISAVLDEPLSDEQFTELVRVLESETVTPDQVAAAVDAVIEGGVTESQAVDLSSSAKVLSSVDGDQAAEIFAAVDISNVSPEDAAAIVSAVQDAPTEVRNSFETEINVFDGAVDTYVPLGSAVNVGTRRVVVAAAAAGAMMSAPGAGGAPTGNSGGSGDSGGSGNGGDGNDSGDTNKKRSRRTKR